jgi:beta-aspartyl-peptidase (threonine type)
MSFVSPSPGSLNRNDYSAAPSEGAFTPVIVLHGGCGGLSLEDPYVGQRGAMREIALRGAELLGQSTPAERVAVEVVRLLEECPVFNAGRGAVFNAAGEHELDASVVRGRDGQAGAVAGARTSRNPILVAERLMNAERGGIVMVGGGGADAYATRTSATEQVPNAFFQTEHRRRQLDAAVAAQRTALDHTQLGTVGCVVLDVRGHLAAATSTGGKTNKVVGRIGDSACIGAGTYASDVVAVSCTGDGEAFIRAVGAFSVHARMKFGGATLKDAAAAVITQEVPRFDGEGGLIAVDAKGNVAMPFGTTGMFRAFCRLGDTEPSVFCTQE